MAERGCCVRGLTSTSFNHERLLGRMGSEFKYIMLIFKVSSTKKRLRYIKETVQGNG